MFKKIYKEIKKFDSIMIFGHVRPDGDCLGSQMGLMELIKENLPKKEVHVVGDNSDYVSFLGKAEKETITDEAIKNSLAIVVDCGDPARVSDMRYQTALEVIKIDHHEINGNDYGKYSYVDSKSPATCAILTEFAIKNKLKINDKAAFALFTGLVTDTGRFRFDSVDSKTFEVASELVKHNVNVEKVDQLLSVETMNVIKFKGYVYENATFVEEGAVYVKVTREAINKYGVSDEDAAAQVSILGGIEGYPIYLLLIEYPTEIRIRFRSRGPRVDLLANKYGGGGHQKAAGGSLKSWDEVDALVNDIKEVLKNYKEEK